MLQYRLTGTFIPFGTKIPNFIDECAKLEKLPQSAGAEGLRVIIPRALAFMYTLRSKRGFGHTGGDVDANAIDCGACVRVADWCLSELIRAVHTLSINEAQAILDTISARQLPLVWVVLDRKRVLNPSLDHREQTLVLLYSSSEGAASADDLFKWTGHSHKTRFDRGILRNLHNQRLIEFDENTRKVILSPSGAK